MTRLLGPAAAIATALAFTSACAAAGGHPATSETPRRDLAARPAPLPAASGVPGSASASPNGRSVSPVPGTTAPGSGPASAPPGSTPGRSSGPGSTAPFSTVVTMPDAAGDAGLGAPAYADLRSVTLADNGTSLRVTVVMNG